MKKTTEYSPVFPYVRFKLPLSFSCAIYAMSIDNIEEKAEEGVFNADEHSSIHMTN